MDKKSYSQKLLDPRWQKKRLEVLSANNFTCVSCGSTDKTLHVHHIEYRQYGDGPWDYEETELVTLCHECHSFEHSELKFAKSEFILALVRNGFWSCNDFSSLADFINGDFSAVNPDAERKIVSLMEKISGKNQNNKA